MTRAVERFKSELEQLSPAERAELASFLLETLGPQETTVAAAWDAEVSRRVTEIHEGRAQGRPAEEIFAELRRQYP